MPKKKGGPTDEQCQRLPSTLWTIFTKKTGVQKRHCSHNRKSIQLNEEKKYPKPETGMMLQLKYLPNPT